MAIFFKGGNPFLIKKKAYNNPKIIFVLYIFSNGKTRFGLGMYLDWANINITFWTIFSHLKFLFHS